MPMRLTTSDADFEARFRAFPRRRSARSRRTSTRRAGDHRRRAQRGDAPLVELTQRFDRFDAQPRAACASRAAEIAAAVAGADRRDGRRADAGARPHRRPSPAPAAARRPLSRCDRAPSSARRWTAVEAVGLYVPGGTASYPSSVLMNAVPASVAGVPRIAMVVPSPRRELNPLVLAAAHLAGVDEIYRIGGAQAVAALAYGTATIAPVAKIVGPGNAYVAAAKRQVFGTVGIDCDRRPVRGAGDRRSRQRSRMDRRRSAGAGRARHRRPVDPDDRRRGIRRRRRARRSSGNSQSCRAATSPAESWRTFGAMILVGRSTRRRRSPTASPPSISRSPRASPKRWLTRIRNAGAIFLGRAHAGGDRRLCRRLQPRAADGAQCALLLGPRRARFHEAHVDPAARPRHRSRALGPAAMTLATRRRARSAPPLGRRSGSARTRAARSCRRARHVSETPDAAARAAGRDHARRGLDRRANPNIEHEREVAIYDILDANSFARRGSRRRALHAEARDRRGSAACSPSAPSRRRRASRSCCRCRRCARS